MKVTILAVLALLGVSAPAWAHDLKAEQRAGEAVSHDDCIVEGWKLRVTERITHLTGSTNCEKGKMHFSFFSSASGEFIDSGFAYIRGFVFEKRFYHSDFPEGEVVMKYVIEEG